MFSKIWMMNVVLIACAVFLGTGVYRVWTEEIPVEETGKNVEKAEKNQADYLTPTKQKRPASASKYGVIAEKNLFDPERRAEETAEENISVQAGVEKNAGDISLYGVIITDALKKALIEYRDGDQVQKRWVKVDDEIFSMKIVAIENERIEFIKGEKRYWVELHEGKSRNTGEKTAENYEKNEKEKQGTPNVVHANGDAKNTELDNPENKVGQEDSRQEMPPERQVEDESPKSESGAVRTFVGGEAKTDTNETPGGGNIPNPFIELLNKQNMKKNKAGD